jgi:hypothetical protein
MPPDESTPDFDSMSPEELMAWMETLAERQGATEGFTTESRMDIAEVDPDSVADEGPGYIPYGMSEEEWAEKKAKEDAERAERIAARKTGQAQAVPPPAAEAPAPVEAPPPAEVPAAAAPASGEAPDFDSMSPEELMAWMETLAERQGAHEGFTTEKRVEIAEVDPESVADSGPGYIPYGMTEEKWAEMQAKEAADRQARMAARQTGEAPLAPVEEPAAAAPVPEPEPEPEMPEIEEEPAAEAPELPMFDLSGADEAIEDTEQVAGAGGLDWLESLAADPAGGEVPSMDLSGLGEEITPLDFGSLSDEPAEQEMSDPMQWLESLTQGDDSIVTATSETGAVTPAESPVESAEAEGDPMLWLESLARRQGVDAEELTTDADLDVPLPEGEVASEAPGYSEYVVEEDVAGPPVQIPENLADLDEIDQLDMVDSDDPAAWLESLAVSHSSEAPRPQAPAPEQPQADQDDIRSTIESAKNADVMRKLSQGADVSSSDMETWMADLLEKGASGSDDVGLPDDEDEDEVVAAEEGEISQAQIPDWLIEQVGPPPDLSAMEDKPQEQPAFVEKLVEPDDVELPDWLKDDMQGEDDMGLDSIFRTTEEEPAVEVPDMPTTPAELGLEDLVATDEVDVDVNDPWVEAFEMERRGELGDLDDIPEWYKAKLAGGDVTVTLPEAPELAEASLPVERELDEGEPVDVPAWMADAMPATPSAPPVKPAAPAPAAVVAEVAEAEPGELPDWLREQVGMDTETELSAVSDVDSEDLPDWLREAGMDKTDTVPDWLIETVTEGEDQPEVAATDFDFLDMETETPAPAAAVVPVAPQPAPANIPAAVSAPEAAAALERARNLVKENKVPEGLAEYETVIRANVDVEHVVGDLTSLIKQAPHKENAAVYRVLGDGMMRAGRLQDALDTYRKALNLL